MIIVKGHTYTQYTNNWKNFKHHNRTNYGLDEKIFYIPQLNQMLVMECNYFIIEEKTRKKLPYDVYIKVYSFINNKKGKMIKKFNHTITP